MYINDNKIDELIEEDGYLDLTSEILNFKNQKAKISFRARDEIVVSSTEEVKRIISKFSGETRYIVRSGTLLQKGDLILEATGEAKELHQAWKVSQNLLEFACGVATKSRSLVQLAKNINPNIEVLTTRKSIPSTKKLSIKAIISGGAYPHRLGLSESILIFQEHLNFIGGYDSLIERLPEIKAKALEKRVIVEVKEIDIAYKLATAGVDIIQFDKLTPKKLQNEVIKLKRDFPNLKLLCAGGVNENNIIEYAKLDIDGVVLSSAYYSKPADIEVKLEIE